MLDKYISDNKQNIIDTIIKSISYKSVSESTNEKDMPFGIECKNVLDYILSKGKELGFTTKNIDGYCGYIEFGTGEELVGIIGHLDVVPAAKEDGWHSEPFKAEIRENKIYGRGAIDDKGPVVAALYAMAAVANTAKINKRVRLIIGLNEETNWECIKRYKETEEIPTISFSPDANFPCIYAEKSIATLTISKNYSLQKDRLIELSSGNNAINVVPKFAYAIIETSEKEKYHPSSGIVIESLSDKKIKITATGKSTHAAFPTNGDNAITKLLMYINNVSPSESINSLIEEGIFELENPNYLGGESLKDESGTLTSNIGYLNYKNEKLIIKTNLRIPINTSFLDIEKSCSNLAKKDNELEWNLADKNEKLYVEKDNYLVKTLTNIFNESTGLNEQPLAIGGGTYARAFPNCISYGMTMPNEEELCHQVNENVDIDNLMTAVKIYAKAIIELAK